MSRFRQKKSGNWARGILAMFWILLAGLSGLYLFSTLTDPSLGGQLVRFTQASGEMTSPIAGSRDHELADIKASLRELSQQVAALSALLKPEQKNAAAQSEDSETDSAPEPATPAASASTSPPEIAAASPPSSSPHAANPEETPAEAPKPAEATPAPEPKPIDQAAVAPQQPAPEAAPAPKPHEPPSVVVSPLEPPVEEEEVPSADAPAPSPPQVATEEAPAPEETPGAAAAPSPSPPEPTPPAATESAALDPIALPPAANDGSTRYGIEIGTVSKQDALRPLWREFLTNHAALVAGLQPRRVLAPDKKWRLIAGPFSSAAEASQACALFKKAARPCEATVYAGDAL
jgi:hypothetical protein